MSKSSKAASFTAGASAPAASPAPATAAPVVPSTGGAASPAANPAPAGAAAPGKPPAPAAGSTKPPKAEFVSLAFEDVVPYLEHHNLRFGVQKPAGEGTAYPLIDDKGGEHVLDIQFGGGDNLLTFPFGINPQGTQLSGYDVTKPWNLEVEMKRGTAEYDHAVRFDAWIVNAMVNAWKMWKGPTCKNVYPDVVEGEYNGISKCHTPEDPIKAAVFDPEKNEPKMRVKVNPLKFNIITVIDHVDLANHDLPVAYDEYGNELNGKDWLKPFSKGIVHARFSGLNYFKKFTPIFRALGVNVLKKDDELKEAPQVKGWSVSRTTKRATP